LHDEELNENRGEDMIVGSTGSMRETKNGYLILSGKYEGKRPL
jgi:hypothetical protein